MASAGYRAAREGLAVFRRPGRGRCRTWSDDSSGGRRRKSYALTEKGKKHVVAERDAWREFFRRFWPMVEDDR